ncbi:nucleotide-binding protein [Bacillus vallismortis]|nr:nucleotide-binding protein [Bacillus vallismortis]
MPKDEKIKILNDLIEKTDSLKFNDGGRLDELLKESEMIIKNICENSSEYISSLKSASFYLSFFPSERADMIRQWQRGQEQLTNLFNTIKKEIQLFEDREPIDSIDEVIEAKTNSIFIVHGRDDLMKLEVARALETLKLNPIILHEQPNDGLTIIEKFEQRSVDCQFAIVLMSPDDMGYLRGKEKSKQFRARQNVILELGYFIGKLGRKNVMTLVKDDPSGSLEIPNDFAGVVYTNFDSGGGWKLQIAKQLASCGYQIDANVLLRN